jgi:hypothetical protein
MGNLTNALGDLSRVSGVVGNQPGPLNNFGGTVYQTPPKVFDDIGSAVKKAVDLDKKYKELRNRAIVEGQLADLMLTGKERGPNNYDAGSLQNRDYIWYQLVLLTGTLPQYKSGNLGDMWILNPAQGVFVTYRTSSDGLETLQFTTPDLGSVKVKF